MDIDYRWVVDEVTDGYRWVSYAGRRNRHVVPPPRAPKVPKWPKNGAFELKTAISRQFLA